MGARQLRRFGLAAVIASLAAYVGGAGASPPPTLTGILGTNYGFVIGDVSANAALAGVNGGEVTFWGAQWWKDNALSGGTLAPGDVTAPAAFKGFAIFDSNSPFDAPFTTGTGNSSNPPPASAIPAGTEMCVLVANSIMQNGSTITGEVTGAVLVKVDAGYDGNPGHAGTGVVEQDPTGMCSDSGSSSGGPGL
jgi:hypothetical protein